MIVYRFLLVSLSIETILGETTIRRRRERLKRIANGQDVGDIYTATFERVRAQGEDRARLGMDAIMWIAYSESPLSPDELCQALGVEIGSADLDSDNVPSIRTILNCGLGLVTVDSSSSVIHLVHFTLQEYIQANPTLFYSAHSMIAEVCLTYLNFGCIRSLWPAFRSPPSPRPTALFLEYASCYWLVHAERQTSTRVISLVLELLDGFNAHLSCELLMGEYFVESVPWDAECDDMRECTALHAGVYFGVVEIMVSLLKADKWDANATDSFGRTALMWATMMGRDAIVKVLLEQDGVDPDISDSDGMTVLSWAAENGDVGIVEMLLGRSGVSLDIVDKSGQTPLSLAAEKGHGEIVRRLLEREEVHPDTPDRGGRTPLSCAARGWWERSREQECERVVKILLERNDVDPDSADKSGRTPLSWAAQYGHREIVRMLLERNEVNPDTPDWGGRTPLSWAVGRWLGG